MMNGWLTLRHRCPSYDVWRSRLGFTMLTELLLISIARVGVSTIGTIGLVFALGISCSSRHPGGYRHRNTTSDASELLRVRTAPADAAVHQVERKMGCTGAMPRSRGIAGIDRECNALHHPHRTLTQCG